MRDAHLAPCSVCTFFFILAHVLLRHYESGLLSEHISKESGVCSVCWLMVSSHLKLWVKPTFQPDMGSLWSISLFLVRPSDTWWKLWSYWNPSMPEHCTSHLWSPSLSLFLCVCNCCDPLEWGGVFMPVIFKDTVSHFKKPQFQKRAPQKACVKCRFS